MLRRGKKAMAGVTAAALAAGILVTGTLAYQSMNQMAANEVKQNINVGARLHDDFNGTNKDVYVENFAEPGEDAKIIFARIRLDEYMEYGSGAGSKPGEPGYEGKHVTVVNADAEPTPTIDDKTTWTTRIPGATIGEAGDDNPFWEKVTWTMGGQTIYMPTFNKDNTSLEADINGTLAGTNPEDKIYYDDYHPWILGEEKTADATYAGDETINETHYAANTLNAKVMTMAEWKEAGSLPGDYWVWDTDGWAYWANPIYPGQSTGLLLDGIEILDDSAAQMYYAINVVGQFVSQDDTGKGKGTGFYEDGTPTPDAETLLEHIGAVTTPQALTVTLTAGDAVPGRTVTFQASKGEVPVDNENLTWIVSGNIAEGTTVSQEGVLTVDPEEPVGSTLTVTAVEKDSGDSFGTYAITVRSGLYVLGGKEAASYMVTAPSSTDIQLNLGDYEPTGTIKWEVAYSGVVGTEIVGRGATATLTVGTGSGTITITAKDDETVCGRVTWWVQNKKLSGVEALGQVVPGSRTTVSVDGVDWYVLVNDGEKAMVWAADNMKTDDSSYISIPFDEGGSVTWQNSSIQSYLHDTVLPTLPTLKARAAATPLHTYNGVTTRVESTDYIFLLSQADLFGKTYVSTAKPEDYTYAGQGKIIVVPDGEMLKSADVQNSWLRTAYGLSSATSVTQLSSTGLNASGKSNTSAGIRPALWVSLG